MDKLKKLFKLPLGFDYHTVPKSNNNKIISALTVAKSYNGCQKHFTIDKDLPCWDHQISADPFEMKIIVKESKNIIRSLGNTKRIVSEAEKQKKLKFRRSIVAGTNLTAGTIIKEEHLNFKRPGTGISPDKTEFIIGRKLKRDIEKDTLFKWEDFE